MADKVMSYTLKRLPLREHVCNFSFITITFYGFKYLSSRYKELTSTELFDFMYTYILSSHKRTVP
jgi:hypothetical protein